MYHSGSCKPHLCNSRGEMAFKFLQNQAFPKQCFGMSFQRYSFNKRYISQIKSALQKSLVETNHSPFLPQWRQTPPAVHLQQGSSPKLQYTKNGPEFISAETVYWGGPTSSLLFSYQSCLVTRIKLRKLPQILPTRCSSQEFQSHEIMKMKLKLCLHPSLWWKIDNYVQPTVWLLPCQRNLHTAMRWTWGNSVHLEGHKTAGMVEKAGRDVSQKFNTIRRMGHNICQLPW